MAQKGNQVEIRPLQGGNISKFHITDIKKDIPDLGWDPQNTLNKDSGDVSSKRETKKQNIIKSLQKQ